MLHEKHLPKDVSNQGLVWFGLLLLPHSTFLDYMSMGWWGWYDMKMVRQKPVEGLIRTLPPSTGVFEVQSSIDRVSHPQAFIEAVRVTAHHSTQSVHQEVTHPGTDQARRCLTWEIGGIPCAQPQWAVACQIKETSLN